MATIRVFSAGVAAKIAKETTARFEAEHTEISVDLEIGGSTDGVNRLRAGEKFDVMILADHSNIEELMMPEYADGYFIWGGNEMAVMGKGINSENWKEVLLDEKSVIKHRDPYGDPVGYRAVMAMMLADRVEPGLSAKLLNHPNYHGLDRNQYDEESKRTRGEVKEGEYHFVYKNIPVSNGMDYAVLPPEMNLGCRELNDVYRTVSFEADGGAVVKGAAILHAVVVPTNAENKEGAEEFVKMFLANRFMMHGFTPVQKKVGNWNIKIPNMWDTEAKSYSMMTLMEINGTNKQLDCIPLEPDFVVLDCGCGPGRVAIQAAKRVKKVICLDSSEGMLEECRKNCEAAGVTNVEYVLADWQETEIGKTIPEVDVVIQSRGGGGPSSLSMLQKAARKYAATVMWAKGAPNLPMSRGKLFVDCYSQEDMERYPELRPFKMRPMPRDNGQLFGGRGPVRMDGKLPMGGEALVQALKARGIEPTVTTIDEGWDKVFATREEAYEELLQLSRHPELVNKEQFRKNVDSFLSPCEGGYYFFLPTQSDVIWFRTRE